ncbi:hypothetical protein BCR33DRAFT_695843 [Rhizoclosmatium globosum]|uniref:Chitinase domain-containing protein 1 n=1 Tax=Rhizoclosmatium globosum TaxID=329046 RepID=A0A1Y2CLZ0_9FUNG|nr:hypothetical protein BCR33DRAFT_695843 [Rhizoclosmatium globosum]|eukprot:ORY48020.1 hypothetical protein BCR33DRAFT_695843 [Rhizoclosmatium globosum]
MAHSPEFEQVVLAYITPWNNRGYDVVKDFRGKFSHLSPVWYQLRPTHSSKGPAFALTGDHDVDQGWIKEVTEPVTPTHGPFAGSTITPKIVPRFVIEIQAREELEALVKDHSHADSVATLIVKECRKQKHSGFVLEFIYSGYTPYLIETLSAAAKQNKLQFFLVIPPKHDGQEHILFDKPQFDLYKSLVNGFSLMTYDYSPNNHPGPNAPIEWVIANILRLCPEENPADRAKLLVGLNLYGNDYSENGHESIVGKKYIELLEAHEPALVWNKDVLEATFEYVDKKGDAHQVWYPTKESIQKRLEAFKALGTGVSLWEVGQGLDYFYALF